MVESFTNTVRDLFENGQVGDVAICYEENSSYTGYHIVMYTGILTNDIDVTTLNRENIFETLKHVFKNHF